MGALSLVCLANTILIFYSEIAKQGQKQIPFKLLLLHLKTKEKQMKKKPNFI